MKKLTAIILAMALILTFTACNSGDGISQSEADRLQEENDRLQGELDKESGGNTGGSSSSYSSAKVGDKIQFGEYDWRVLDIQDGKALILSGNIIETRPYNNMQTESITWEQCDLRAYLNGEFHNSFSSAEQVRIVETTVINKDNQWYGTSGGNHTADKVFLLSLEEAIGYFGDSGQLKNKPNDDSYIIYDEYNSYIIYDEYNEARIAENKDGYSDMWWLRSPGYFSYYAANVSDDGCVDVYGYGVNFNRGGVRPALWLNL